MTGLRILLVVFTLLGYVQHASCKNKTTKDWTAAAQKAVWETSQVFHRTIISMSDMDTKGTSKTAPPFLKAVTKYSSKVAGLFGVAGALFSIVLALMPDTNTESAELKYMRSEFDKLSQKIDSVAQSIDDVKDLIKLNTQKAAYIRDQNKIHHGVSQMNECYNKIQNVSCTSQQDCKRKKLAIAEGYIAAMNVRANVENILRGTVNETAFGNSFLDLLEEEGDCNVPKINRFINKVVSLIINGMKTAIFHDFLTKASYEYLTDVDRIFHMIKELEAKRQNIEDSCLQSINNNIHLDVRKSHSKFVGDSNRTNIIILQSFARKYPWIDWHVITMHGNKEPVARPTNSVRSRFLSSSKEKEIHAFVIPTMERKVKKLRSKGSALIDMLRNINFGSDTEKAADTVQSKINNTLELDGKVQSFAILPGSDIILGYYVNRTMQQFALKGTVLTNMNLFLSRPHYRSSDDDIAVVVTFDFDKTPQMTCSKSCDNGGKCYFFPYSNDMECRCTMKFSGERCEFSNTNFRHQFVINSLLTTTMKLPSFSSIQNTLEDTQLYVKTSLTNIKDSIARLEAKIDEKFKVLGSFMSEKFDWFTVLLKYKDAIENLDYFQSLSDRNIKDTTWQFNRTINVTAVEVVERQPL